MNASEIQKWEIYNKKLVANSFRFAPKFNRGALYNKRQTIFEKLVDLHLLTLGKLGSISSLKYGSRHRRITVLKPYLPWLQLQYTF